MLPFDEYYEKRLKLQTYIKHMIHDTKDKYSVYIFTLMSDP